MGGIEISLPIPNLDNRTFEQLLQEARKSISNYASQWTNHNPADPGITLIELFAWLAEITSYRINLVTEEHRLKYLKLLGIRRQGILPATVDLNFKTEKKMEEEIYLEQGTVFLAEKAGKEIEFELIENITVIPICLEKIIVNENSMVPSPDSSSKLSHVSKLSKGIFDRSVTTNKDDLFFAPFSLETRENSVLYLGFNFKSSVNIKKDNEKEDNEYPYKTLNFMCYIYEKGLIEPGKHGDEAEYEFKNATLKWEYFCPSEETGWKEVKPEDRTQNFRKTGNFIFTKLEGWVPSLRKEVCDSEKKYFWLRCTLLESEYEYPPRIEEIRLNTATVVQKKRVKDGLLKESNGLPDQVFELTETHVLRESLKLVLSEKWIEVEDFDGSGPESPHFTLDSLKGEIRFGDGLRGKVPRDGTEIRAIEWKEWIEVEDFDGSGPESSHFTLDSLKGEIRFGDGLRGKVPRDGTKILALEYVTCKGERGNLQAGSKWILKEKKVKGLEISNLKPASGGKGEESIDDAFKRFKRDMEIPYRAVTSEDFEKIALQTPGLRIAQAKVIQNFNPYIPADRDGSVTVIIIPYSPLDTFESLPEPSRGFRDAVAKHLEKYRLLGTRIHVVSPEYVRVDVKASLVIFKGFFEERVRENILDKLKHFLHPVKGGANGKGWPVGEPVYRSVIFRTIMEIEGVEWVEKIDIHAQQGAKPNEDGDLILGSKIATVYSGEHSIEILRREGKR